MQRMSKSKPRKLSISSRKSTRKSSFINSTCSFKVLSKDAGNYKIQITDEFASFHPVGNFILKITPEDRTYNETLIKEDQNCWIQIGNCPLFTKFN